MYQTTTILEMIRKANANRICLPSIQRQFVWKPTQIEKLFDSIYYDYPIGTFLIWEVMGDRMTDYRFYHLLRDYHERDRRFNEQVPHPYPNDRIEAFLDGQQRMTALYIGLQGSYTSRRINARINNNDAYVAKRLYFNLLGFRILERENFEDGDIKLFRMLSEDELNNFRNNQESAYVWHPISDFVDNRWNNFPESSIEYNRQITDVIRNYTENNAINTILSDHQRLYLITHHIGNMLQKIRKDHIINFYSIQNNTQLDDVAEIFIRVNDGGTKLSKSDLMFSTVVAQWEQGRQQIQQLIKDVKLIGFDIDTDFVMRTCLYLTQSQILFKVDNFRATTINLIIDTFQTNGEQRDIRNSILDLFYLLKDRLGISEKMLKSKNVLIPIIYHIFKGGNFDDLYSIKEIKKYLYISLLKKVFGSHGDTLLNQLRNSVTEVVNEERRYRLSDESFNYLELVRGMTDTYKRDLYNVSRDDVDNFLNFKIGEESWMVLSLLYPRLDHDLVTFDQDHLHPVARFRRDYFNCTDNEFNELIEIRDTVPNLGFLRATENRSVKRASMLGEYVENQIVDSGNYREYNLIGFNVSLDLANFREFYRDRRERMYNKLLETFEINEPAQFRDNDLIGGQEDHPVIPPLAPLPNDRNNHMEIDPVQRLSMRREHLSSNIDDGRGPNIRGIKINGIEIILLEKINTTKVYKHFMNYCIENFAFRRDETVVFKKLTGIEPTEEFFGTDAINYPDRILCHNDLYYNSHTGSQQKKNRIVDIANEFDLSVEFVY